MFNFPKSNQPFAKPPLARQQPRVVTRLRYNNRTQCREALQRGVSPFCAAAKHYWQCGIDYLSSYIPESALK